MAEAMAVAGTGLQAFSQIRQGQAANANAKFEARQLEKRAKAERAVSQRQAIEDKRQIDLAGSSAKAKIAGGGAAVASSTFTNILGGLDFEAGQAFDAKIASGETQATASELQANTRKKEGKAAQAAGYVAAATTIAKAAAGPTGQSLFSKYGSSGTIKGSAGRTTIGTSTRTDRLR